MVGFELIEKYPRYKLLSANCQTFAILFLREICCNVEGEQKIEEIFEKDRLKIGRKRLTITN
jgi:hypothetical protein